ncbi:MAG: RNA polymerase sigma factor [Bacteroidota bacterium]
MRKSFYDESDRTLVQDCLAGDEQAQQTLYEQYAQAMYNVAVRMVNRSADAEDILQEVFVKVFRNLHTFQGDSTIGAWIKRITVNSTLNFIRSQKNYQIVEVSEAWNPPLEETETEVSAYNMTDIHYAIKQLPERCRAIVSLYLIEGYQHKEIAQILDITESTSKTQYRRGRQLLQDLLRRR